MTTLNGKELTAQDLARVRKLLAEDAAVLVECTRISPQGSAPVRRRMVRQWPKISDADRALCEAYLGDYASAKNEAAGTTVEDPMADRNVYAGTWRMIRTDLSRLRTDPAQQGVYQTLIWPADSSGNAGGMCEESSPLHHEDATVYSESAHVPTAAHKNTQGTIYRANAQIDPETGLWSGKETRDDARTPALYSTTSRTAERVTVTTKGEHQKNPETAGASKPTGTAAKGTPTVEAAADMDPYGLWSTQRREMWPVERITATADTSHPKWDEVEVSAANVDAVPKMDSACKAASYSPNAQLGRYAVLTGMSVRGNEFGLLDVSASWRIPKAVAETVSTVARSAEATTIVLHGEHLRTEELAGKHLDDATSTTMQAVAAAHGGNTFRGDKVANNATTAMMGNYAYGELRKELDEFGLWTADMRVTVPVSVCHAVANVHQKHVDVEAVLANVSSFPSLADATRLGSLKLPTGAMEVHAIPLDTSFRGNEAGLLDVTARWRVPLPVDPVTYETSHRADATTTVTHGEHQTSAEPGRHAEREIWEFRKELDEFGLWTSDFRVTTAITQTHDYVSSERADATTHVYHGAHAQSVPGQQGTKYSIVDTRQDLDEFGLWNYDCRVTEPQLDIIVEHEDASHSLWKDKEMVFSNYSKPISNLYKTGNNDIVVSLNFRKNEFGLLDGSVTIRTPKQKTMDWRQVGDDPDGKRWQCWGWNMTNPALKSKGGSSDAAIIVSETRNSLNEFGLWDYVGTAEEDKNPYGSGGWVSFNSGQSEKKAVFINNVDEAHPVGTSKGYIMWVQYTSMTYVCAKRSLTAATDAASSKVTGKAKQDVKTSIGRHGRWYTVTAVVTTRN